MQDVLLIYESIVSFLVSGLKLPWGAWSSVSTIFLLPQRATRNLVPLQNESPGFLKLEWNACLPSQGICPSILSRLSCAEKMICFSLRGMNIIESVVWLHSMESSLGCCKRWKECVAEEMGWHCFACRDVCSARGYLIYGWQKRRRRRIGRKKARHSSADFCHL